MGTRSDIIGKLRDGKWKRVYCHWDGYLDHNGDILFNHYKTQDRVEALLAPGDMSVLREDCSKPEGHSFDKPAKGCTVYYGRDRGEDGAEGITGETLEAVWPEAGSWTEFTYVWDGSQWWVGDPDEGTQTLIDLGDALQGDALLRPAIKSPWGVIGRHSGAVAGAPADPPPGDKAA